VRDGEIVEYQVRVKLTFRVETADEPLLALEEAETILQEPTAGDGEEPEPAAVERLLEELSEPGGPEPRP